MVIDIKESLKCILKFMSTENAFYMSWPESRDWISNEQEGFPFETAHWSQ